MSIRGWNSSRPFWSILDTKENKAGTTIVSKYDYLVNAIGQRSNVAQSGTAFAGSRDIAWGYDPLGQVTSADSTIPGLDRAYQFDLIGNRLKTADSLTLPVANNYTPNLLNQYTTIDTLNPVHDDDGNMTAGPLPANVNANSTLIWDGENRLIQAQVTGGATVNFIYDSQSRRIAETVGTATKITVYDGWNPIAEYSISNNQYSISKTYLWGMDLSGTLQGAGGVGGLLAVTDSTGTYYPTYDGNGNVSEYLDSTGAVVAHYEYDPFGKTTVASGSKAQDFSHRFSTKPLDLTTGLYYYAYRYYDPQTGRWLSRDPIGEEGGINLYGFLGNNSLNNVDILGLEELLKDCCEVERQLVKSLEKSLEKLLSEHHELTRASVDTRNQIAELKSELVNVTSEITRRQQMSNEARFAFFEQCGRGRGTISEGCRQAQINFTRAQTQLTIVRAKRLPLTHSIAEKSQKLQSLNDRKTIVLGELAQTLEDLPKAREALNDCISRHENEKCKCQTTL